MCDTVVALANATADGSVIFAKNSDREPNEAHHLQLVPAAEYELNSPLKCTYIEIPQVAHTFAVLLAKPFWMWGAEMGANEFGVVIGNEAVFTKVPYGKDPALTGMDLLRLGLERGRTAEEALRVITALLAVHGQGGNCGFKHPFYYHNSFLIADPKEAWVLETAGQQWAAQKVKDIRSISNGLTIETEWDLASEGLVDFAVEQGWCKDRSTFNFRQSYSDFLYTKFSDSRKRHSCATDRLRSEIGRITPQNVMSLLSSHNGDVLPGWSPDQGIYGADICMHVGFGPIRASQTVGSLVSHLSGSEFTHWVTGTAAPCTSLFKPVWMDSLSDGYGVPASPDLPGSGPIPTGEFDPDSLFWRHERLHREILRSYTARKAALRPEMSAMQTRWLNEAAALAGCSPEEHFKFSQACFDEEKASEEAWLEKIRQIPEHGQTFYTQMAWKRFNKEAKFPAA